MQYILILRELSEQEKRRVRTIEKGKDVEIVALQELKYAYQNTKAYIKLTEKEKKKINYKLFSELLEFGDFVIDNQTIANHFNIGGAALWYCHKFRIYFKIRNQGYKINELNKNLSGAKSAIIFTDDRSLQHSDFACDQVEICIVSLKKTHSLSVWSLIQYGFVVLFRFTKSILTPLVRFKSKKIVCIDNVDQYRNILSLNGKTTIFENAYIGYLYQKMGDQFGFIDQLLIPKFRGKDRYKFKVAHLKNFNNRARILGERIMAGGLFSLHVLREIVRYQKTLKNKYKKISGAIENQHIKRQILAEFISLNSTSLFYLFKFLAYKKFFRKNKFASILTTDEGSPNYRIILDAAKQNGIFTIGYQHGSIHELHPAYMYTQADLLQKPMPDLTITWGGKWNNLLVNKGNYTREMLRAAGQIRTDVIRKLEQNDEINRETVIMGLGQMQIVLFATQPQRDPSLRYKAAEDVVIACKNLRSVYLIFKLHPRENDSDFYINVAEKYHLENYTISRDEDLFTLLKISDIVITCFSTVGTEALYFYKPLIILDHLRQDILNYYKDGVAFQAANSKELQFCIDAILAGRLKIKAHVLQKYILDSTYKIDGMTSERVWNLLNITLD